MPVHLRPVIEEALQLLRSTLPAGVELHFDSTAHVPSVRADASQIHQVSDEIARRFQPERIILFGSYAYGTPTDDSDVDLLVIMPLPNKSRGKASDIRLHLDVKFPLDLVVCDPTYLAQRIAMNDFFLREITERGRVLHAGDHAAVG